MDPTVAPMLARLARSLPVGEGWRYEPKWDGFRCLAFVDGDDVDLRSRNGRPLARYFPEIVEPLRRLPSPVALDGELLVPGGVGFDFDALLKRIHPAASRVTLLASERPATYMAFDVLAEAPFDERRRRLESLLAGVEPPLVLSPLTCSADEAAVWLERFVGGGIDGVVAKRGDSPYEPGKRTMVKVKPDVTADCVVGGFRPSAKGVGSLLLGLHDNEGRLAHVGVVSSLKAEERAAVAERLAALVVPLEGHPWEQGFALEGGAMGRLPGSAGRWRPGMPQDWIPVAPTLVCEVGYDQLDGVRFRHPARFRCWRPDRTPESCTLDQLAREGDDPAAWLR